MYAIIANGSKQYKAAVGDTIKFEKLDANVGDKVEFEVLLVSDENGVKLGADVSGVKAVGEVVAQDKARKVIVFKYKAKKNIRKKQGHRQPFTAVKIETIG
ncbi:MAG: 50S ribosomal protein L21 [Clostridia bacterium]|nr:50S ribosomal protein L21 [Clostridia bacterium]